MESLASTAEAWAALPIVLRGALAEVGASDPLFCALFDGVLEEARDVVEQFVPGVALDASDAAADSLLELWRAAGPAVAGALRRVAAFSTLDAAGAR
eukprot:15048663-Heterocapsa_arctica.AAC.1